MAAASCTEGGSCGANLADFSGLFTDRDEAFITEMWKRKTDSGLWTFAELSRAAFLRDGHANVWTVWIGLVSSWNDHIAGSPSLKLRPKSLETIPKSHNRLDIRDQEMKIQAFQWQTSEQIHPSLLAAEEWIDGIGTSVRLRNVICEQK